MPILELTNEKPARLCALAEQWEDVPGSRLPCGNKRQVNDEERMADVLYLAAQIHGGAALSGNSKGARVACCPVPGSPGAAICQVPIFINRVCFHV